MQSDIERVLVDGPAIHKRLDEMAAQITADYSDREPTVIAILTGSLMFMSDLLRRIPLPLKLDCLSVVRHHGKTQTSGDVIFKQMAVPDLAGQDVLILDDILDTGYTLAAVRKKLETAKPRSIRVCVLLSKKKQRARDVDADYVGFEIDDEFVVGYGLDFMERYRNLPYLGVLREGIAGATKPMNVRVQFYAQLRELIGAHKLELELPEGATVREMLEKIYAQRPALRAHDKSILVGAGLEFVDRNYKLNPGEEIAIMPPVQGG